MLILPVGLDQNEVRRTPWVTWVVMGTCLAVHLALGLFGGGADRQATQRIEESLLYLGEHPYLSPPPELLAILGERGRAALDRIAAEWEAQNEPVPADVAAEEQEELDRLGAEAIGALRSLPSRRLGFMPADFNPVNLVTYTFVHGGWLHLLGNMLFLFLTGPFIEDLYGRPLFALLYVLSGIAGAGAFAAGSPHTITVLLGASGAIAGVMGAFLVRLGTRRIRFLVMPFPILPTLRFTLRFPAFVVIPAWAAEQFYYASVAGADSPVAFSAHVGGLLMGLLFALVMRLLGIEERYVHPAIEQQISIEQNPAILGAADARLAGDLPGAGRLIDGVLKAEPGNVDAWTESWHTGLEGADGERASQAGIRLIELHGRGSDKDMVWTVVNDPRWREMRMTGRFLLVVADVLSRAGDAREAVEVYRRLAAEAPAGDLSSLRALVSEGELMMRAGDERAARQAFDRARSHPACSDPWRQRMDQAVLNRRAARS
jgi:membrane associated rhomboid family serine protease